MVHFCCKKSY